MVAVGPGPWREQKPLLVPVWRRAAVDDVEDWVSTAVLPMGSPRSLYIDPCGRSRFMSLVKGGEVVDKEAVAGCCFNQNKGDNSTRVPDLIEITRACPRTRPLGQ